MYLSFYCNVCVWEGVGDRTKTAIYWPHSYGHQHCLSRSPDAQPEGREPTLLTFSTASYHQLVWSSNSIGGPEGPFDWVWLSLPHLVSITSDLQLSDFLSWPSYIIVQCPLNLWNGMFDRHQAEITVMQFTGHCLPVHQSMSVPWDFFTLSHFVSQASLCDFLS